MVTTYQSSRIIRIIFNLLYLLITAGGLYLAVFKQFYPALIIVPVLDLTLLGISMLFVIRLYIENSCLYVCYSIFGVYELKREKRMDDIISIDFSTFTNYGRRVEWLNITYKPAADVKYVHDKLQMRLYSHSNEEPLVRIDLPVEPGLAPKQLISDIYSYLKHRGYTVSTGCLETSRAGITTFQLKVVQQ